MSSVLHPTLARELRESKRLQKFFNSLPRILPPPDRPRSARSQKRRDTPYLPWSLPSEPAIPSAGDRGPRPVPVLRGLGWLSEGSAPLPYGHNTPSQICHVERRTSAREGESKHPENTSGVNADTGSSRTNFAPTRYHQRANPSSENKRHCLTPTAVPQCT
jgi:hypothetical protein